MSLINLPFIGLNLRSRNAKKSIKPPKNSKYGLKSKIILCQKNGSAGLMTSSNNIQICMNILSISIHQQKTRTPNAECFFFIANYMTSRVFRGFERLSLWRQVMASYSQSWNSPQISVLGSKILTIFCFLSHNFRSRYASKSIKGFKDSFSSQESKRTMSEKNFTLARGPGPDKFGLKLPKHALIVT